MQGFHPPTSLCEYQEYKNRKLIEVIRLSTMSNKMRYPTYIAPKEESYIVADNKMYGEQSIHSDIFDMSNRAKHVIDMVMSSTSNITHRSMLKYFQCLLLA